MVRKTMAKCLLAILLMLSGAVGTHVNAESSPASLGFSKSFNRLFEAPELSGAARQSWIKNPHTGDLPRGYEGDEHQAATAETSAETNSCFDLRFGMARGWSSLDFFQDWFSQPSEDPYWNYYSDCDRWQVVFVSVSPRAYQDPAADVKQPILQLSSAARLPSLLWLLPWDQFSTSHFFADMNRIRETVRQRSSWMVKVSRHAHDANRAILSQLTRVDSGANLAIWQGLKAARSRNDVALEVNTNYQPQTVARIKTLVIWELKTAECLGWISRQFGQLSAQISEHAQARLHTLEKTEQQVD